MRPIKRLTVPLVRGVLDLITGSDRLPPTRLLMNMVIGDKTPIFKPEWDTLERRYA
jgi:hypothetical protein